MDRVEAEGRGTYRRRVSLRAPPCDLTPPTSNITHTEYPLVVPCSTIAFTINLHNFHSQTLSQAYQIATREFIKLRAINEIANFAAEEEAFAYSASSGEGKGAEGSSRKAFVSRFFSLLGPWIRFCLNLGLTNYVVNVIRIIGPILRPGDPSAPDQLHYRQHPFFHLYFHFHCHQSLFHLDLCPTPKSIPLRAQPS